MKYLISPFIQVQDINGTPICGAKIVVCLADTSTSILTYQNFDGAFNTDPVLTDELGNATVLVDDDCGLCDVYIYDDKDNLLMSKKYITPGAEGGGGGSHTTVSEGYGIIVDNPTSNVYVVSVDTSLIATKEYVYETYQEKLSAGDNIEITPQNIINVTGRKNIATIDPLYTVEDDNHLYFAFNTSSFVQNSDMYQYLTTAQYQSDSATFLTGVDLSDYATKEWCSGEFDNKLDVSAFDNYVSSAVSSLMPSIVYTTANPGGASSYSGSLLFSQRADNHMSTPIEVYVDEQKVGVLPPTNPQYDGCVLITRDYKPSWVYSGDLKEPTLYKRTCVSGGSVYATEYKQIISVPDMSGLRPRYVVGSLDWASTDGRLAIFPVTTYSNTSYINSYDTAQNYNVGHGDSNLWNTQPFTFTANDNEKMKYIAIKGGAGQSVSCANIHFTCVY